MNKSEIEALIENAESFMKKAPYLPYDLAKKLIEALRETLNQGK